MIPRRAPNAIACATAEAVRPGQGRDATGSPRTRESLPPIQGWWSASVGLWFLHASVLSASVGRRCPRHFQGFHIAATPNGPGHQRHQIAPDRRLALDTVAPLVYGSPRTDQFPIPRSATAERGLFMYARVVGAPSHASRSQAFLRATRRERPTPPRPASMGRPTRITSASRARTILT